MLEKQDGQFQVENIHIKHPLKRRVAHLIFNRQIHPEKSKCTRTHTKEKPRRNRVTVCSVFILVPDHNKVTGQISVVIVMGWASTCDLILRRIGVEFA